jgi:hypothetical protein
MIVKNNNLLEFDSVQSSKTSKMFRRNALPQFSGYKQNYGTATYMLGLIFDPEDGRSILLRNVGENL